MAAPANHTFSSLTSGKCLDVTGASTANWAQVIQWTCGTGKTKQEWTVS
ncbi:RICIN domain-containing protein [Kitasatospora sp. NPDC001159]